ncbi:MAG: hypothetical protein ACI4BA_09085 [Prevotella sp.]
MKKIHSTILLVAMLFGMQSSVMAETYEAWGTVSFTYVTTPMYDANETIEVTDETINFHSDTWGDGTFNAVNGEGTLTMAGHGGAKDYAADITGSVESQQFIITVPSVMGGTVITVTLGEIPAPAAVDGSYTGGTYANATYFQKYLPAAEQTVSIKANEGFKTVTVSYTSETWGTFTFEAVSVTKNADNSYSLAGEGACDMPNMQTGNVTNYASDFNGTITNGVLVAEFIVPAVMGGTTVLFNPADIDEVIASGINNIRVEEAELPVYNMNGVRVDATYKGVVIKGGRKYNQR